MEPKIDMSNLARMMLEWEMLRRRADALQAEIKTTVVEIKRTQTVGNVRASYSAGRKSYDYREAVIEGASPLVYEAIVRLYTTTPAPKTDWRKVCDHVGIEKDEIPFTQSEPSVRVFLLAE